MLFIYDVGNFRCPNGDDGKHYADEQKHRVNEAEETKKHDFEQQRIGRTVQWSGCTDRMSY
jgi:hypothetical protein